MVWLAIWKAKKLEQRGSEEEESVIDLEGKGDHGRKTCKVCVSMHNVTCRMLIQIGQTQRMRCTMMNELDREESFGRRREWERGSDESIQATTTAEQEETLSRRSKRERLRRQNKTHEERSAK